MAVATSVIPVETFSGLSRERMIHALAEQVAELLAHCEPEDRAQFVTLLPFCRVCGNPGDPICCS